jgi:hypothetical protein
MEAKQIGVVLCISNQKSNPVNETQITQPMVKRLFLLNTVLVFSL